MRGNRRGRCDAQQEIAANDFLYTHSIRTPEDKESRIAGIKSRRRSVEPERLSVRNVGDVALLSGTSVYKICRAVSRRLALSRDPRRAAGLGSPTRELAVSCRTGVKIASRD